MNSTLAGQPSSQQQTTFSTLQLLISLFFFAGVFRIFRFLKTLFGPYFYRRHNLYKRYGGGWAVVTGGSQGIGEGIAGELAKEGFDLILVSRSLTKLGQAKQKIQKVNPQIKIEVYSIDFCKVTTEKQYLQAFKPILEKDVSVLVNNVGFANILPFDQLEFPLLRTQIKVNLLPISVLTRLFTQKFLQRQHKSAIINLSSGAAIAVFKAQCNYGATKTFIDSFSRAFEYEVQGKIEVLTVRPYFVTTPMTKNLKGATSVTPESLGKETLNALANTDICYGTISHRIQGAIMSQMSEKIVTKMTNSALQKFVKLYNNKKE